MEKTFIINQLIQKENDMKKLENKKTGQGKILTTGCLLDYYIKNFYRLIAVDLSKQKEFQIQKQFSKYNFLEH